jgi:hypothetical protein
MKPLCRGTDKEGNTVFPCDPELTEAMDVFAAGCVTAEVFLDGDPLFDQSQLLQYRAAGEARRLAKAKGGNAPEYEPPALAKITDPLVQVVVPCFQLLVLPRFQVCFAFVVPHVIPGTGPPYDPVRPC